MKCTQCSADNSATAKFCTKCGAALASVPMDISCPSCGATCKPGVRFCTKCGHGLEVAAPSSQISPTSTSRSAQIQATDSKPAVAEAKKHGLGIGSKIVIGGFVVLIVIFFIGLRAPPEDNSSSGTVQEEAPASVDGPIPDSGAALVDDPSTAYPSQVTFAETETVDSTMDADALAASEPIEPSVDDPSELPDESLVEPATELVAAPSDTNLSTMPAQVSADASLDDQYELRRHECAKGFLGGGCRKKIRRELCDGLWSDSPPAGQSVCETGNQ